MNLATEVGLSTIRAGRAIHIPVKKVDPIAAHLTSDELDRLTLTPSSVNSNGLWVQVSLRLASSERPS